VKGPKGGASVRSRAGVALGYKTRRRLRAVIKQLALLQTPQLPTTTMSFTNARRFVTPSGDVVLRSKFSVPEMDAHRYPHMTAQAVSEINRSSLSVADWLLDRRQS